MDKAFFLPTGAGNRSLTKNSDVAPSRNRHGRSAAPALVDEVQTVLDAGVFLLATERGARRASEWNSAPLKIARRSPPICADPNEFAESGQGSLFGEFHLATGNRSRIAERRRPGTPSLVFFSLPGLRVDSGSCHGLTRWDTNADRPAHEGKWGQCLVRVSRHHRSKD